MKRVELEPGTLIIGDLHLDPASAEDCARLVDWLAVLDAPRLVVLGDLFDAWVGPAHEELAGARAVLDGFAAQTARGTAIHVLHGNRDFLYGDSFASRSGARVHPDGLMASLEDGTSVCIIHGDELCTLDHAYQRLRRVTRSKSLSWLAPRIPLAIGGRVARRLRSASVQAVASKPSEEKAMQVQACRDLARASGAAVVVCGHAHLARDEELSDGPRWIVLDAFGGPRDVLQVCAAGALELVSSASSR